MEIIGSLNKIVQFFGRQISKKQAERSLLLISGIIESKTVNLWSCAETLSRRSDIEYTSNQLYEQYLRHFQTGKHEELLKAYFLSTFYLTQEYSSRELVIDRTEWQLGSQWQNLLVIGYICHDTLIPLVWQDLGERKSSSTADRLSLLDRLCEWWTLTNVPLPPLMLYGDREFIGANWLSSLLKRDIEFVVRLRKNQKFPIMRNGQMTETTYSVQHLSKSLLGSGIGSIDIVVDEEVIIPLVCARQVVKEEGKRVIKTWYLAAHIKDLKNASKRYSRRWTIENIFGHLKRKGLNLEDYNLVGQHKMEIMFGLVVIVSALCIHQSLREKLVRNRKMKHYKDGRTYPAKSTFKLGLERVRQLVNSIDDLLILIIRSFNRFLKYYKTKKFILKKSIVQ